MQNYKELAESILSDLMNNSSLSDILLKLKIFAAKKKDKELIEWVDNELEGYKEKPPKYRIIEAGLRVDVFVPFRGVTRIDFPFEVIKKKEVRERLSKMAFHNSIAEIEAMCKDSGEDSYIAMHVPVGVYSYITEFLNGQIQNAYQHTTKAAVSQILVSIKSITIDYLLRVSNEEDIDFNSFIKDNLQMKDTITINAAVVNTGSGNVNAQGSTSVIGSNNTLNMDSRKELLRILSEIDKIAALTKPNLEYEEISKDIKEELKKGIPMNNYLKRCFQAIPAFLSNVGAGVIANKLSHLISSAVSLL